MLFFCEVLVDPKHKLLSFFLMVQFNQKKKLLVTNKLPTEFRLN